MSRVSARWVSRLSTSENLEKRVELPRQFIEKFDKGGATFLDRIITTDGRWLRYWSLLRFIKVYVPMYV